MKATATTAVTRATTSKVVAISRSGVKKCPSLPSEIEIWTKSHQNLSPLAGADRVAASL